MDRWFSQLDYEKESAKTRYFSDFALKHFGEMRILKKGGVLGKDNAEWRNVSEHCLVEAVGADILCEYLGADKEAVVTAVLLHDWHKRKEVEEMKKSGVVEGYVRAAEENDELLRRYGLPDQIIKLTHANIPESNDPEYLSNRTLEEKIIHFVDMITSDSQFIDFQTRLEDVEKQELTVQFIESFRKKYGGHHLNEIQREAATMEQEEFERILNIQSNTLVHFIQEKLGERIGRS